MLRRRRVRNHRTHLLATGRFLGIMSDLTLRFRAKPWSVRVLPIDLGTQSLIFGWVFYGYGVCLWKELWINRLLFSDAIDHPGRVIGRRRKEPCPPAVFAQSNCFSCDAAKTEKPKSTAATADRNPPAGRSRNQSDIVWKLSDDECSDALAVT